MPIENNNLETVKREHTKEDISLKKELETREKNINKYPE